MTTWKIDVEMRMRKTLVVSAGDDEADIRNLIQSILSRESDLPLEIFQKYIPDPRGVKASPVETIIDNDPQIVEIREIQEEGR